MQSRTPVLAWLLLMLLSLIWGSSFILIKRALVGLNPTELGALRIFLAGVVMLPLAIRRFGRVPKHRIKFLIVIALVGSFIPSFLFAIAQTRLASSLTGVLNAVTPIFTILIGVLIYGQKKDPRVYIGVLIGFMGTATLITNGSLGSIQHINAYALLIVIASMLYGVNGNVIKFHLSDLPALTITSVSLSFGGIVSGLYLVFFTDYFHRVSHLEEVLHASYYVVFLGVLGTALALVIFNRLVQLTDPVFTSSVTYIIPIVAVLWGLWDGESLYPAHYIGIILILLGVYITNRLSARKQKKLNP
ncbi:MAG: DMT family transporter [Cyclobacteriaceae bacterium]